MLRIEEEEKETIGLVTLFLLVSSLIAYGVISVASKKEQDIFVHKGKTYTASRICPRREKMYWKVSSGFMKKTKIEELGCMTASENEAYRREYKLRQAGTPKGRVDSGAAARMNMESKNDAAEKFR